MFGEEGKKRSSLIESAIKTAVIIGGVSWLAASWISAAAERQTLARGAWQASHGEDPATTGSIGLRAATGRIDPCAAPQR